MSSPIIPTPQDTRLLLQDTVTKTASYNTPGLDLGSGYAPGGPGQRVTSLVAVGARAPTPRQQTYSAVLQESSDDSTYTACGAATTVTATGVAVVRGVITKRYV